MTSRVAILAAERARKRIELEIENRTLMLIVHGLLLLLVGLLMITTGAPAIAEDWFGPWVRIVLGAWALGAGSSIVFGAALTDEDRRGWLLLLGGMAGAALWHLALCVAYAVAAFTNEMMLLVPGEILESSSTSRGYIPVIYLGYVALVTIHAITLVRLGPPPR